MTSETGECSTFQNVEGKEFQILGATIWNARELKRLLGGLWAKSANAANIALHAAIASGIGERNALLTEGCLKVIFQTCISNM